VRNSSFRPNAGRAELFVVKVVLGAPSSIDDPSIHVLEMSAFTGGYMVSVKMKGEAFVLVGRQTWSRGAMAACLLAFAVLASCGDDEKSPEAKIESHLFEETAVCNAASLSGACRGPWAYQSYVTPCYNQRAAAPCPLELYQYNKTCLHAEYGFSWPTPPRMEYVTCTGCTSSNARARLASTCSGRGNAYRATATGDLTPIVAQTAILNVVREDSARWVADCSIVLANATTSQHSACGTVSEWRYQLCADPAFGEAPLGSCGTDFSVRASTSGLTAPAFLAAYPYSVPSSNQCSTLEADPVGPERLASTMARSNPQDPFWVALPGAATQEAAARADLVKEAKLMFELGVTSPAVTINDLRALYSASPSDELSCGVSARPPVSETCHTWGVNHEIEGPLGLCQRMLSSHIVPAVFAGEVDRCLDLLGTAALQESSPCAAEYRTAAEALAERLLDKALTEIRKPAGTTVILGLDGFLRHIDRWYAGAAQAFVAAPPELADASGRVLRAFWEKVYQVGATLPGAFPAGDAGSEGARAVLAELFSEHLEADRQVLLAAFSQPAPLDEIPLLLIASDALSALHERLRTAAPFYDFACRIKGSCVAGPPNEATLLIRLIGALGNDEQLGQALAASTAVRAPWREAFTALRGQRAALETAYRRAAGRPDASLGELYQGNVVPAAAGLGELVARSAGMWSSYQAHGVLLPREETDLRASLTDAARVETFNLFSASRTETNVARAEYQRVRGDFANAVLSKITLRQYQDRLDSESSILRRDYDDLSRDLNRLMASQDQAEQVGGRFMASYIARAGASEWLPDYPISTTPHTLTVSASAALGTGIPVSNADQVPQVAIRDPLVPAQPLLINVQKGDMVSFSVDGLWSPSCALRQTVLAGPQGNSSFLDPSHTLVGTEGFAISWRAGSFRAREHSSTSFETESEGNSVCGSISANLLATGSLGSLAAAASYCRQWQTGYGEIDTTSSGSRFTSGAHFAGGVRVPGTPFPNAPAGALLMVEVETIAGADRLRDVQVIRPHTTISFRDAAKVYLVVNDRAGCAFDSSALSVTYAHAHSTVTAARALAEVMADVIGDLESAKANYVAQGSVTSMELAALHHSAYVRLLATCGACTLSNFPEQVRTMFEAWLSAQLAAIERQTRIAAAERALDSLVLRLAALEEDLAGSAESSRLNALMTTWQLGHLAFHQLRPKTDFLLEIGNTYVMPMLRTRYPQALATLRASSSDEIETVRALDWTLPFDEMAQALDGLASAVETRIGQARVSGGQASVAVLVAFPKPGQPTPPITGAVVAAPDRLSAVWEPCGGDYCLRQRPVFTIAPEDVYGRPGVGLRCGDAAPVVHALAVFAANSGSSTNAAWNATPRNFDIFRGADVRFPAETGILGYRTGDPRGAHTSSSVRSLAGVGTEAWTTFATFALSDHGSEGTSPFSSFALEFGTAAASPPLSLTHTMVVIFEVDTRAALSPLAGIEICNGGAQ
jgi:hypothetical protein